MDVTLWDDIPRRQIDTLVLRYPGRVRRILESGGGLPAAGWVRGWGCRGSFSHGGQLHSDGVFRKLILTQTCPMVL